jgi:hypothetical protein
MGFNKGTGMTYEQFLTPFERKLKTGKGFLVVCPAHADSPKGPSLSVSPANDGGVLLKCFAGCSTESVVKSLGLTLRDLFAEEKAKPFSPPIKTSPRPISDSAKPIIEKIYQYLDATGKPVYQAIRLKPKSFRQRHMKDGKWVWTMDGVERVLYRLPEILKSQTVFVVEGEKDADNLAEIGIQATCNVGGAGKWLDGYTESLAGKDVVLCGDNDEPGRKHVSMVFDSIAGAAKTVRIIKLPETIKDASDYIAGFKTKDEAKAAFDDLVSNAYPHIHGTKLPIFSISEIQEDYRRLVRSMDVNSFSLASWLPSLRCIRNLIPGELVFIIGNTGVGKTGIAQSIARASRPMPTLFFELELPKEMMFERFAAMATNLTGQHIEAAFRSEAGKDESISDVLDARLKNLYICPESRLTVQQIESYIMRAELKMGERPKLVIIDYIQLMKASGANRREKVSDIAEDLKCMAKATQTIVIATSQVARPPNLKDDEKWEPGLHSAKESGSIENSCGLLLSAFRDNEGLNIRVLKSTKGGAGAFVRCNFDGSRMIITEKSNLPNYDTD